MLTLLGSLTGLLIALVLLVALVYLIVRHSLVQYSSWYFLGILMLFGAGLGIAAFMSLISPMAHDLIVIGVCVALAFTWAVLHFGLGEKIIILGLLAIIAIYGYSGYSAYLFATGRSPLARVPQTTSSATTQVEMARPAFQDRGSSMIPSAKPNIQREAPALPMPNPEARQSQTAKPEQRTSRSAASPEPSTTPSPKAQLRVRPVTVPRPSSQPSESAVGEPVPSLQDRTPVSTPDPEPIQLGTSSGSTTPNSAGAQTAPPISVPEGCYGRREQGSLDCLLESQQ